MCIKFFVVDTSNIKMLPPTYLLPNSSFCNTSTCVSILKFCAGVSYAIQTSKCKEKHLLMMQRFSLHTSRNAQKRILPHLCDVTCAQVLSMIIV